MEKKKVNSYNIAQPKDFYILDECPQFEATMNGFLKPYRCKSQHEFKKELKEITDEVNSTKHDGLVLTFEDQETLNVLQVVGTHTRVKSFHNSLRYYIILEVN
jgi:hypothetical protein